MNVPYVYHQQAICSIRCKPIKNSQISLSLCRHALVVTAFLSAIKLKIAWGTVRRHFVALRVVGNGYGGWDVVFASGFVEARP